MEGRAWGPARRARRLSARARGAACFGHEDEATIARERGGLIAKRRRRPGGEGAAPRGWGDNRARSENGGDATTRGAVRPNSE